MLQIVPKHYAFANPDWIALQESMAQVPKE